MTPEEKAKLARIAIAVAESPTKQDIELKKDGRTRFRVSNF